MTTGIIANADEFMNTPDGTPVISATGYVGIVSTQAVTGEKVWRPTAGSRLWYEFMLRDEECYLFPMEILERPSARRARLSFGDLIVEPRDSPWSARFDYNRSARDFSDDPALAGDALERAARLPALMDSPDWQDRVRAQVVCSSLKSAVTLPDRFPAIVEVADSPNLTRIPLGNPRTKPDSDRVWVAHPDQAVLAAVLEEYQAMWDGHTAQWGPNSRRVFAVRLVDGIPVHSLKRPECGPDDILREAASTHTFWAHIRPELNPWYKPKIDA